MASFFKLEIFTPYRLFYADDVEYIVLRIYDGDIGIYAGHSQFSAPVSTCIMKIRDKKGAEKYAFIAKGMIEVKKNKTVLLVDAANFPEEIDAERALTAKNEALKTISGSAFKFANASAVEKLKRAEVRIKLCEMSKSHTSGD